MRTAAALHCTEGGAPGGQDLEGADPGSQRGGAPGGQDSEGADPVSQRGVPLEVRIWKGRIQGPRGGCP